MNTRWILLGALVLSGCGTAYSVVSSYPSGDRHRVAVDFPAMRITMVDVSESIKRPSRVLVQPNMSRIYGLAFDGSQNQFAALFTQIEPVYRKAAEDVMAQQHPGCVLSNPTPYPDYFAIEFEKICN